jgi:hypothetical protein
MSEILVNEIKHRNGTSAIAINTSAQMTVRGEGGNATTNLQQGLAKGFASTNNLGTIIHESLNISSLDDVDTGKQQLNFTSNMSGLNYLSNTNANSSQNDWGHCGTFAKTTSKCDTTGYDVNAAYQDNRMDTIFLGDLA